MAGIIRAVITDDARKYFAQYLGNVQDNELFRPTRFKVGEGGWIDDGSGAIPREPQPDLRRLSSPLNQEIDAIVDATRVVVDQRYASDSRGYFEKALTNADFTFVSPSVLRVRCLVDAVEFNNDGFGNAPEIWEIGLYGHLQGGTAAVYSAGATPTFTITGLSGMVPTDIGSTLSLFNSPNSANNGTFTIASYISATSVTITNANVGSAVEATSLTWATSNRSLMMVYGTFPKVTKTGARPFETYIDMAF
jgi:hypothetical protein